VSFSLDAIGVVHPNGQRALAGVTLAARDGERLAVIGPSGAGKTTLLRVLGAALRPNEGRRSARTGRRGNWRPAR
jgi:phosphonate transport system ATP-binding protein